MFAHMVTVGRHLAIVPASTGMSRGFMRKIGILINLTEGIISKAHRDLDRHMICRLKKGVIVEMARLTRRGLRKAQRLHNCRNA